MTPGFIAGHSQRRERNPRWKGGQAINGNGYRLVLAPVGHPNALANGYILEHRLVTSQKIGRPLMDTEIVHHINGDKLDNRPENLELTDRADHRGMHDPNESIRLPPKICPTCGKAFRKQFNQARDVFCSRACIRGTAPKGAGHHAAKLTADLVRQIRRRAEAGETHQAIADSLSVKREAVSKIVRRERWAHVP